MAVRKTLTVSSRSWHGRAYLYWRRHATYKEIERHPRENLCHYMRVVLIWAPLGWLARTHVKKGVEFSWMALFFSIVAVIIYAALWITIPWQTLGGTAMVVGIVGAIIFLAWLDHTLKERKRKRQLNPPDPADEGFMSVLVRAASAKKAKVCPFIDIEDDIDIEEHVSAA